MYLFSGGYYSFDGYNKPECHYYIADYQGNNRMVVNARTNEVEQTTHYYPYGGIIGNLSSNQEAQKYKYSGKALAAIEKIDNLRREREALAEGQDRTYGLDLYDFHARLFNPALPVFDRPDPLAEDFTWLTPYNYCAGDPVNLIDPTGCSLQVVFIDSTRYMVVDGAFDDDNTIYEVAWNDEGELERTGKTIGGTATEWSFYDSDTKSWASGSIIDLSDDSAYPFMEKIDDDGEILLTYMEKGRNGQEYDFKIRGDKYRGMLASFMGGAETIASARDIGNYAAGYKAGSKGLSPVITFASFSAYDCKKNGRIGIEPSGSRKPQWMGYKSGFKKYLRKSIGL